MRAVQAFARRPSVLLLLPAFAITAGIFAAAMLLLFSYSAYTFRGGQLTEEVSFLAWRKFFTDPFYWGVVGNTLQLALGVTAFSLLVGYPAAYALTKVRSQKLLIAAYIIIFSPLLVSVVVRAYGWILLLADSGVINTALRATGVIREPIPLIFNNTGVVIALVHILLPFMIFPILSGLLQFDNAQREAANDLGADRIQTFARVVLPLSLPGVIAGAQIVFTLAISAFVTPALLGGGKVQVLSRDIWFNVVDVNWPIAAVEAIVLLALALSALAVFDVVGRSLRSMRTLGTPRPRERSPGGPIDILLRLALIAVLAFMLSPLAFIVVNSFNSAAFNTFPPSGFSLRWYQFVLSYAPFREGMVNSLIIAGASTLIALAAGTPAALALVRGRIVGRASLRAFFLSPLIMPKVAIGIAVFILLIKLRLFGSLGSLIMVHSMLSLPFCIVLLTASLVGVNRTQEEAAMDLGAGPLRTFWHVTMPQIRAALIVAAVFAFITSFDETEASIFLVRPSNTTLPIQMFLYLEQYQNPTLAALSTLLIALTVVVVVVGLRFVRGAELARLVARGRV
ncbi:MAG TPA: ABC transporter permease subunit [Candidatus Limnocylindria bacterium]|nr:ABC transporter permease subunit [Candidatus Limnocylindria bacterium]